MSVRAYKLIEIKTEDNSTFNVWHDDRIMDIMDTGDMNEGGGIISTTPELAKELLEELQKEEQTEETKDLIEKVNKIIADCAEEELVQYYCF